MGSIARLSLHHARSEDVFEIPRRARERDRATDVGLELFKHVLELSHSFQKLEAPSRAFGLGGIVRVPDLLHPILSDEDSIILLFAHRRDSIHRARDGRKRRNIFPDGVRDIFTVILKKIVLQIRRRALTDQVVVHARNAEIGYGRIPGRARFRILDGARKIGFVINEEIQFDSFPRILFKFSFHRLRDLRFVRPLYLVARNKYSQLRGLAGRCGGRILAALPAANCRQRKYGRKGACQSSFYNLSHKTSLFRFCGNF